MTNNAINDVDFDAGNLELSNTVRELRDRIAELEDQLDDRYMEGYAEGYDRGWDGGYESGVENEGYGF